MRPRPTIIQGQKAGAGASTGVGPSDAAQPPSPVPGTLAPGPTVITPMTPRPASPGNAAPAGASKANAAASAVRQPTRIQSTEQPARPAPAASATVVATRMSPTMVDPARAATAATPTGAAPQALAPHRPSALAGVQRLPFRASAEQLLQRFPAAAADMPMLLQCIASAPLPQAPALDWSRFGEPAQQQLAQLVRQRLQLADEPPLRQAPMLLRQLHARMQDLLAALHGGVFRRTPAKVWSATAPEVAFVETRLQQALAQLQQHQVQLGALRASTAEVQRQLRVQDMACAYLLDQVSGDVLGVLTARATATLASLALANEQLQLLQLDQEQLRELIALVQDGVLVKLPAVLAQLAQLRSGLGETQRLLLSEAVQELKSFIERRLPSS